MRHGHRYPQPARVHLPSVTCLDEDVFSVVLVDDLRGEASVGYDLQDRSVPPVVAAATILPLKGGEALMQIRLTGAP